MTDRRPVRTVEKLKNLVALCAMTSVIAACLGSDAIGVDPELIDRPEPGPTTIPVVDWTDPAKRADLGEGWTVGACDGDGPFLCVERNNDPVGVIEAIAFPVASFEQIDQTADDLAKLEEFARNYHSDISEDRAKGCGEDYGFEKLGPDRVELGGQPGVFFGFAGWLPDGRRSELNLQYATIVEDQFLLIAANAYEEGGCPGRDDLSTWDSGSLSGFRSRMAKLLAASPLLQL